MSAKTLQVWAFLVVALCARYCGAAPTSLEATFLQLVVLYDDVGDRTDYEVNQDLNLVRSDFEMNDRRAAEGVTGLFDGSYRIRLDELEQRARAVARILARIPEADDQRLVAGQLISGVDEGPTESIGERVSLRMIQQLREFLLTSRTLVVADLIANQQVGSSKFKFLNPGWLVCEPGNWLSKLAERIQLNSIDRLGVPLIYFGFTSEDRLLRGSGAYLMSEAARQRETGQLFVDALKQATVRYPEAGKPIWKRFEDDRMKHALQRQQVESLTKTIERVFGNALERIRRNK